jgi:hypothetical protein
VALVWAPSQRRALGALFLVLAALFAGIAVAAAGAGIWVIAVAGAALALWLAGMSIRALRPLRKTPG